MLIKAALSLSVLIVSGLLLSVALQIPELLSLMRHFDETNGVVVSNDPKNHLSITVQYLANNARRQLVLAGYSWGPGSKVQVFYDLKNPDFATIEEPTHVFRSQLTFSLICALVIAAVAATYLFGLERSHPGGATELRRVVSPRVGMTLITAGTVVGTAFDLLREGPRPLPLLSTLLAAAGCVILLARARHMPPESGWKAFIQSFSFFREWA
jgi:hypothetical protein